MRIQKRLLSWMAVACFCPPVFAGTITVLQPDVSTNVKLAEGIEFSAYVKGNRWDMSDAEDITISESRNLSNETFLNGVYSALTNDSPDGRTDSKFYLTWPGLPAAVYSIESGQKYPIDTSLYRYLTIKIRHLNDNGAPTGTLHPVKVFFFQDENSIRDGVFGSTNSISVASDGDWHVVRFDLVEDVPPTSNYGWSDFSSVKGLRIDPTIYANTGIEVDWIRLTAPGDTATGYSVQWSGGTEPYSITARRQNDISVTMASGLTGTSANVDFSTLPSGAYTIEVLDEQGSGTSTGSLQVNEAPLFHFLQPDIRGDVGRRYSLIEAGNPWGPFDSEDVASSKQLNNISFSDPAGALTATSTGPDSRIFFNTPRAIDTLKYRMLTYTISVSGSRDIGLGSVTRVLWGSNLTTLTTSKNIVLQEGLNTYEIGDLRNLLTEGGLANQWVGAPEYFRLDPHEFPLARDIRLDNVTIAPLDSANPTFNVTWLDSDGDDNSTINLYADVDHIPGNSNEVLITSGISEDLNTNSFIWNAPDDVAGGEYFLYAQIDDGLNQTIRYATGPISVGSGPLIEGTVNENELRNISTRTDVGNANDIAIAGFIVSGSTQKCLVIRGRGPSVGVSSDVTRLNDPVLELKSGSTTIAQNDNWQTQELPDDVNIISSLGAAPFNSRESAIHKCLNPGAYTALMSGKNGSTGVGIVEVLDVDSGMPYLVNISTRARVGVGNLVTIAGFIISGNEPKQILIRGRGPTVSVPIGVNRLDNPRLQLFAQFSDGSNMRMLNNDNWMQAENANEISALGKAPADSRESAILMTLDPGAYTAILDGVNSTSGIGLVEVFDLSGR